MKSIKFAAIAVAMAVIGNAGAANISFQTGYSNATAQLTAEDYQHVVDTAIAAHPYGSATLDSYDIVSNQSLFHSSATDIAFKSTIVFGLDTAGTYAFRAGVDFGNGGAMFLDGHAIDMKTTDMWWAHDYVNTNSVFSASNLSLAAGNHTLTIYGLEGCCDGGQQVQYSANNGLTYQSFTRSTLMAAVPEPETYAMMLGGLALVGGAARRRKPSNA